MKKNGIVIAVLIALVCASGVSAYDRVQYETHWRTRARLASDTVAILTTLTDPMYGEPFDLEIAYFLEVDSVQDPRLYLSDGGCEFYMDREDHTWPGLYRKGDTLRCRFSMTPLMIGTVTIGFRIDFAHHSWTNVHFTLTLDETGRAIKNPLVDEGLRGLGLLPETMPDTLYFTGHPCRPDAVSGGFGLVTKLSPPFNREAVSTIDVHAKAACPFPDGVYYSIVYPDFLDVSIPDSSDWERYVAQDEELNLRLEAKPVGPGVGTIEIVIRGMRLEVIPTIKDEAWIPPAIDARVKIAVAVDEDLELLACTEDSFTGPVGSSESSRASERLSAIQAISQPSIERRRIYSPHWKVHESELLRLLH